MLNTSNVSSYSNINVCNINNQYNNGGFSVEFTGTSNMFYTQDCTEEYKVKYDTPRINEGILNDAIIAGTPFDYGVSVESNVVCSIKTHTITVPTMNYVPVPTVPEPTYRNVYKTIEKTCKRPISDDEEPPKTGPGAGEEYRPELMSNNVLEFYKKNILRVTKYEYYDCSYKVFSHKEQTNKAEIEAAKKAKAAAEAHNAKAASYNAEVNAFVNAANKKPGVSVSIGGTINSSKDLDSLWAALNALPDTLPDTPQSTNPDVNMTITEDSKSTTYNMVSDKDEYRIPYKTVVDALKGDLIELKDGKIPNKPFYELSEEMKKRSIVNKDGYNYFTNIYTKENEIKVNGNGYIIYDNKRGIKVNISTRGKNFDIECGYEIISDVIDSGINIMYRPIDFNDVFPNRTPRWNWRSEAAKEALENPKLFGPDSSVVYSQSNLEYSINMNKEFINTLRDLGSNYYNGEAYKFDLLCDGSDVSSCKSQLIERDGSSNITRGNK